MKADKKKVGPMSHRRLIAAIMGLALQVCFYLATPSVHAGDSLQTFLQALGTDDAGIVSRMASLGLDTKTRDDSNNTLLMLAIEEDGEKIAMALLRQPAWQARTVLEHENQLGETALMIAAKKISIPTAKRLIDLGAQVNRTGWTALHHAAAAGSEDMIRLLVQKNAFVDATAPDGTTPLMMAASANNRAAAALLVELGADPTATNDDGQRPSSLANQEGYKDMAFWLEIQEAVQKSKQLIDDLKANSDDEFADSEDQPAAVPVTKKPTSRRNNSRRSAPPAPPKPVDAFIPEPPGVEVFRGIQ